MKEKVYDESMTDRPTNKSPSTIYTSRLLELRCYNTGRIFIFLSHTYDRHILQSIEREIVAMEVTPNHTQYVSGWAAMDASIQVLPFSFKRRENGMDDVTIKMQYCGMSHNNLHFINNDRGMTMCPVVPSHEITGVVTNVSGFKQGWHQRVRLQAR